MSEYGIETGNIWDFYSLRFNHRGHPVSGDHYSFLDGSGGNNHPGHDRLIADGRRLLVPTVYDQTTHKLVADSYSIIDAETVKQDKIALTQQEIAAITQLKLNTIIREIESTAESKVAEYIDPIEKAHWMGVHDAYSRQNALWLEEFTRADVEQRAPDEESYPPLTTEEHLVWFSLSLIQGNTSSVRGAAREMIAILHNMNAEEINDLSSDWVSTHTLWP